PDVRASMRPAGGGACPWRWWQLTRESAHGVTCGIKTQMTANRSKSEATAELVKRGLSPGLLDLDLGAAYLDPSPAAFPQGVERSIYPQPLKDGRRQHWDRRALDAAIDRRSGLAPSCEETFDDLTRAIDAA